MQAEHTDKVDSDEDGIEWENTPIKVRESGAEFDSSQVNLELVRNALQSHFRSSSKKRAPQEQLQQPKEVKKAKSQRLTLVDKHRIVEIHKTHLLCLLIREIKCNRLCNEMALQGLVVSMLPSSIYQTVRDTIKEHGVTTENTIKTIVDWFRKSFQTTPYKYSNFSKHKQHFTPPPPDIFTTFRTNAEYGKDDLSSLKVCVLSGKGYSHQLVLIFTALCRGLNIYTRYTCSLDPRDLTEKNSKGKHFFGVVFQPCSKDEDTSVKVTNLNPIRLWNEVYCDYTDYSISERRRTTRSSHRIEGNLPLKREQIKIVKKWIQVDSITGVVNKPLEYEGKRGSIFSYVVSLEKSGKISDVTKRYATKWSKSVLHRLPHEDLSWWEDLLSFMNLQVNNCDNNDEMDRLEKEELEKSASAEGFPTNSEAFRKHYLYVMEKYLKKEEYIHPKKSVGTFKNQPVYLRENVHVLRSKSKWFRECRIVLPDELNKPCKVVDKRMSDEKLNLYGYWQTEKYKPLPAIDGIIPKNQYGNIELWSDEFLPLNTVHLTNQGIHVSAKKLGIDYAPALVGFDFKNGYNYPVFNGIIVCQESAKALLDAHIVLQQHTIEMANSRRLKQIYSNWKRIIKKALLHSRLEKDYGRF